MTTTTTEAAETQQRTYTVTLTVSDPKGKRDATSRVIRVGSAEAVFDHIVISPSNASNDTVKKKRVYHQRQVPQYWLIDPVQETLSVLRWSPDGYTEVLSAMRGERVKAEPFEAIELQGGVFFGDDEDEVAE